MQFRLLAQVLSALRSELFRILLLQRVDFFDRHSEAELNSLLSTELETVRSFVLSNVSRDRGLRAILEALGAVGASSVRTFKEDYKAALCRTLMLQMGKQQES